MPSSGFKAANLNVPSLENNASFCDTIPMTNTNPNSSRDTRAEGPASKTNFFTVFVDKHVYGLDVKEAETIFKVGHITPIPRSTKKWSGL